MRITHHCYAVTGLGYASPWSVNAGFIAGQERTLVIDTGSNSLSAATIYGYAHAVRPANRMRVINTERHFDHIGGNHFFAQRGVPIAAHFGVVRTESEFEAEIQEFNDSITNPVRRRLHEANVFFSGTRLKLPDEAISTDCRLELGACSVDVILTPGHTPHQSIDLAANRWRIVLRRLSDQWLHTEPRRLLPAGMGALAPLPRSHRATGPAASGPRPRPHPERCRRSVRTDPAPSRHHSSGARPRLLADFSPSAFSLDRKATSALALPNSRPIPSQRKPAQTPRQLGTGKASGYPLNILRLAAHKPILGHGKSFEQLARFVRSRELLPQTLTPPHCRFTKPGAGGSTCATPGSSSLKVKLQRQLDLPRSS